MDNGAGLRVASEDKAQPALQDPPAEAGGGRPNAGRGREAPRQSWKPRRGGRECGGSVVSRSPDVPAEAEAARWGEPRGGQLGGRTEGETAGRGASGGRGTARGSGRGRTAVGAREGKAGGDS